MVEWAMSKAVERMLRRSTGAGQIGETEVLAPVWGGNGQVLRVALHGGSVPTVVVKLVSLPKAGRRKKIADRAVARTVASYDNELLFYQQYAAQLPKSVVVPQWFAGQRQPDGWVFVVEDLLHRGYRTGRKQWTDQDIAAALEWLAGFHATFASQRGEGLWKQGSYWNLAGREVERARMTHQPLAQGAQRLEAALNQCRYQTLIHGDAKADNFCVAEDGAVGVAGVDFQYVGRGCGMKDVVCLLDSLLTPIEVGVQGEKYLDLYFEHLLRGVERVGCDWEGAELEREWRALYPVAWADYYRFLDGWAPGKYPPEAEVKRMVEKALAAGA